MKLNPPRPSSREAGFHREAISSTEGGFLPQTADLVEKKHCTRSAFFLANDYNFDTKQCFIIALLFQFDKMISVQ